MVINITDDEVRIIQEKDKDAVIIDVRMPVEFNNGTIAGAININLFNPEFHNEMKNLDPSLTYLMLCQSGNRAGTAAAHMVKMGFKNVCNIIGGILAWEGKVVNPKAA